VSQVAARCRMRGLWGGVHGAARLQIDAFLAWLSDKEAAQAKLDPHEEPAFTSTEVRCRAHGCGKCLHGVSFEVHVISLSCLRCCATAARLHVVA
jgi:hypothetical protein